ncbi:lipid-A-disaccharide synthase [Ottowia caeni]|uniref:lipid-A-disaccharide synthase n=1 Tax=Ottowia caeni TaxID=2870339 RepID=UPI001E5A05B5|nr:lipid-A-disaccharide synthase [Ottowia caeni]
MSESPTISLVAGEPSGDMLAALLLQSLRARWPGLRAGGIGGAHMAEQGFDAWWPVEKLSVRGYLEVLPRLPELLRIRRQLADRLLKERPDLFIGVDAPDFNFDLEARLKSAGLKTLHFISPSFWAWRPEKLLKLKAAADHVLCLFPFEPEMLAEHGIAATFVGHPLANIIPMKPNRPAARQGLGLEGDGPVVALLPGSRAAEVKHLLPRFLQAAAHIRHSRPNARFIVPAVAHLHGQIELAAQASGLGAALTVVPGQSHQVLAACDVTLIASGTATLEAALFKCPMVIAYAMPAISYRLMRRMRQLPWIGLPNVLCAPGHWLRRPPEIAPHAFADRPDAPFVVPELVQDAATPQALAEAVLDWLDTPEKISAIEQRFAMLHEELHRDTSRLATDVIESLLAR